MKRVLVLLAVLVLFMGVDLAATAIALEHVDGARELNPLPAFAFELGIAAAAALKLFAAAAAVAFVLVVGRAHERQTELVLGAWCAIYAAINLASLYQLSRAGVIV